MPNPFQKRSFFPFPFFWLKTMMVLLLGMSNQAFSSEFSILGLFRPLDLGDKAQPPEKTYTVNVGSLDGVQVGTVLEVLRKVPVYNMLNTAFQQDVLIPIARIQVIAVNTKTALTRLVSLLPTPNGSPPYTDFILTGDPVQIILSPQNT